MLVLAETCADPSVTDEELEALRVCQLGPGGARAPGDSRRDRLSGGPAAGGRSGPFSAARSRGMYPPGLPRFAATKSVFVDPSPGRNLRCCRLDDLSKFGEKQLAVEVVEEDRSSLSAAGGRGRSLQAPENGGDEA
jgi:hypothetical protein